MRGSSNAKRPAQGATGNRHQGGAVTTVVRYERPTSDGQDQRQACLVRHSGHCQPGPFALRLAEPARQAKVKVVRKTCFDTFKQVRRAWARLAECIANDTPQAGVQQAMQVSYGTARRLARRTTRRKAATRCFSVGSVRDTSLRPGGSKRSPIRSSRPKQSRGKRRAP